MTLNMAISPINLNPTPLTRHFIYEIPILPLLGQLNAKLPDIPTNFWTHLQRQGITAIWPMGVWRRSDPPTIQRYCFAPDLIQTYQEALPNFSPKDVAGSPYAIFSYDVNEQIGTIANLQSLKTLLNNLGILLILDFVPNHFSAESIYIRSHPTIFLQGSENLIASDPSTFYRPISNQNLILAHGRDPYFPAWQDTAQVNYFSQHARSFMTQKLLDIAAVCDGVRCDMAMLALNEIFSNTWGRVLQEKSIEPPTTEFWNIAIKAVKQQYPNFLFIAEVYWGKEWQMQQLGFDLTYDKTLFDRFEIREGVSATSMATSIKAHLASSIDFQQYLLRFLENHDEPRTATRLPKEASRAAAVTITTIPGSCLFFDGQFNGAKIKTPVQLNRFQVEPVDEDLVQFYSTLLAIVKHKVFRKGYWQMLNVLPASDGWSSNNLLTWIWQLKNEARLVVVNYSNQYACGHIQSEFFENFLHSNSLRFLDLFTSQSYTYLRHDLKNTGLGIILPPFGFHIFDVISV